VVLIETFLPALISLAPKEEAWNALVACAYGQRSRAEWLEARAPPKFLLDVRCASLMRSVILCCAFNAGLPVLNFALAGCLAVRLLSDSAVLDFRVRLVRAGAELPRALEVTLLFAAFVQAVMAWVVLRASRSNGGGPVEAIFLALSGLMAWAVCGYASFKMRRARDCCCGAGEWALRAAPPLRAALRRAHSAFMVAVFGVDVFGEYEDNFDETEGRPYAEVAARAQRSLVRGVAADGAPLEMQAACANLLVRGTPYFMPERDQQESRGDAPSSGLGGGAGPAAEPGAEGAPLGPAWTVPQLREWIDACARQEHTRVKRELELSGR
jgi:hypothetical protein